MFGFTFEVAFKVKGGTVREVLEVFRNVNAFVGQQIEDSLWNFIGTTREDVTNCSLTGSFVSIESPCIFPHFVTLGTAVRFGVHSQVLDVAEVAAVEVQVHGIGVATVGTLYQLSYYIGLVFLFVITFYESIYVNVQFE
jgi:hypothetical protein